MDERSGDPDATVRAWLEASNAGDGPAIMALSAADIELIGPRGSTRGCAELLEWLERARVRFETRGVFSAAEQVVVDQHAVWHDTSGAVRAEGRVVSRFVVAGGVVRQVQRYDNLAEALRDAGLGEAVALR